MSFFVTFFLFLVFVLSIKSSVVGPTFLFSVFTALIYIIPYFSLIEILKHLNLISESYLPAFFIFIFICYCAFIIGNQLYQEDFQNVSVVHTIKSVIYEKYSIIIGVVGVLGYGFFIYNTGLDTYLIGHGSGDYSIGGYIYELRYFTFSSVLLLFTSFLRKNISKKGFFFLLFFTFLLVLDAYIQAQRGSWIRIGSIFILSFLFNESNQSLQLGTMFKKYKIIVLLGIFFAFLLIFTVQVRKFASPDISIIDQIVETVGYIKDNPDLLVGGSGIDEGNEFVSAYNAFVGSSNSNQHDYGYKWLYPLINFIPRKLWTNKPTAHEFSIDEFSIIDNYSTITHAPGSVLTGYIDTFFRFSWYSPLFFLLFGYFLKRLSIKAKKELSARLLYIVLYIGLFYFLTQGEFPMVLFSLYMYIPIWFVVKRSFIRII